MHCDLCLTRRRLEMFRGNTLVFDVQVKKAPGDTPVNITGWTMWFTAKYYVTDPDNQAVSQRGNMAPLVGITFTQPLVGKAQVTMPPIATVYLPDSEIELVYDVQVKDPTTGVVSTIEVGELVVSPHATRAF